MILAIVTIVGGALVAIALGICIGLWFVSRESKDDAEQTWKRTQVKETKPPPVASPPTVFVVGERFADETPRMRELRAKAVIDKVREADKPARDPHLPARIDASIKPDDITVARVKRTIAKNNKRKTRK